MICPKCEYEWMPRVENPKACPMCKQYLKKNITFPKPLPDQTHWDVVGVGRFDLKGEQVAELDMNQNVIEAPIEEDFVEQTLILDDGTIQRR